LYIAGGKHSVVVVVVEDRMPENVSTDPAYWALFYFVITGWFTFAIVFISRKRPAGSPKPIRNNQSIWGVLLMGVGMALVWWLRRPVGTAIVSISLPVCYLVDLVACALTVASIWFILAAVRVLGKQWNVRAIVVEQHQLITSGPYAIVRHPIYTGMFGLMLATGLANSTWYALLLALAFAIPGTLMRIHQEEILLRDNFGIQFETYQKAVPALLPKLRRHGHAAYQAPASDGTGAVEPDRGRAKM
jgi:isoprenylcysteine carboxyl methyltransferase (ICMT) family protein YpbQ